MAIYTEDFNTSQDPITGLANWGQCGATASSGRANDNRYVSNRTDSADQSAYWAANTFTDDQAAQMSFPRNRDADFYRTGLVLRAGPGNAALMCRFQWRSTERTFGFYWWNSSGTRAQIGGNVTPSDTVEIGTIMRLEVVGDTMTLKVDYGSGFVTEATRDISGLSGRPTSGAPGIYIVDGQVGGYQIAGEDWQGEDLGTVPLTGSAAHSLDLTVSGTGAGSVTDQQQASGIAAFVASALTATMVASATATPPQQVFGAGVQALTLSAPAQSSAGTSVPIILGSAAHALDLNITSSGAGTAIPPQQVTGSGAFTGLNLSAIMSGVGSNSAVLSGSGNILGELTVVGTGSGLSVPFIYGAGGTVEFNAPDLVVTGAGNGSISGAPGVVGGGPQYFPDLTVTGAGTGTAAAPQVVTGIGAFSLDLATITQNSSGASNVEGTISGQAVGLNLDLQSTFVGSGLVFQPQIVTGTAAHSLDLSLSGSGDATGSFVTNGDGGTQNLSLSIPTQVGIGAVLPPPAVDYSWEDDDITWGGVELASRDFAPMFLQGDTFKVYGYGLSVYLDVYLERTGIVLERGKEIEVGYVYPHITGPVGSTVQISLGSHETPEGAIDWEGPYDFSIGEDTFVDFSIAGNYLAIRFESSGIPVWALQSYDIEYRVIGNI